MKKKLSAGLAALALTVAAFSPLGGATSAATAAEFSTMAATACSQTITPSTVTFNVGGSPFAQCYNGTTYFTSGNRTVVKIKTGAYQAYATFQEYGTFRIPANTEQSFNNLLITKLVVG